MPVTKIGGKHVDIARTDNGVDTIVGGVLMSLTVEEFNDTIDVMKEAQRVFGILPVITLPAKTITDFFKQPIPPYGTGSLPPYMYPTLISNNAADSIGPL